jgi:hypothetical protein
MLHPLLATNVKYVFHVVTKITTQNFRTSQKIIAMSQDAKFVLFVVELQHKCSKSMPFVPNLIKKEISYLVPKWGAQCEAEAVHSPPCGAKIKNVWT